MLGRAQEFATRAVTGTIDGVTGRFKCRLQTPVERRFIFDDENSHRLFITHATLNVG